MNSLRSNNISRRSIDSDSESTIHHLRPPKTDRAATMFRLIITSLLLAASAFALPTAPLTTAPFTQTCTGSATDGGTWPLYTVNIGVPFFNGVGCGGIYRTLVSQIGSSPEGFAACGLNTVGVRGGKPVCSYTCTSADAGASTLLTFHTFLGQGPDINIVSENDNDWGRGERMMCLLLICD